MMVLAEVQMNVILKELAKNLKTECHYLHVTNIGRQLNRHLYTTNVNLLSLLAASFVSLLPSFSYKCIRIYVAFSTAGHPQICVESWLNPY